MASQRPLILASTSRYRRDLLERLRIPFTVHSPEVDETPLPHEHPLALAQRLAHAKAHAVAKLHSVAIVIGSDQVADLNGQPLGKPLTHERAVAQLQAMRGHTVVFHTAVSVHCIDTGFASTEVAPIHVQFRTADTGMSDAQIERYLRAEQPYDCAGSAKSEGLGISLIAAMRSDDPTALIGLPHIHVCSLLQRAGLSVLGDA